MVDREGVAASNTNMLTIQSLTTRLQSQSLAEQSVSTRQAAVNAAAAASASLLNHSSQDENAAKIRHHSEPHPPAAVASFLSDSTKKVKILTFKDGMCREASLLLSSTAALNHSSTTASWDCSSSNPPNKRQCRSMSIPNDGELRSSWLQNKANKLHRPLAVRPNSGGSRSKSHQIGHYRGGGQASANTLGRTLPLVWPSLSISDAGTPPESPRSRPSSASSGYFDSPLASSSNLNKNRCESLQTLPSMESHTCLESPTPQSNRSLRVISAKSMPSVADSCSSHNSASRSKQPLGTLLRCQSQPCVIHERRSGIKRRRNDEPRPSINFSKMTETAFGRASSIDLASAVISTRLTSPLKIRPAARYDQVLQTIASSPQDTNYISAMASPTSSGMSPSLLVKTPPFHHADSVGSGEADNDSGCSTTDDELCDITNRMSSSSTPASDNTCHHRGLPTADSAAGNPRSACLCPGESDLDIMFAMDPNQDPELDIDMIENN